MGGLGLDCVPPPVPSGLAGLSGDADASVGDAAAPRRGDTGVRERLGLGPAEAGLVGEVDVARRFEEEEDNGEEDMDEGVPGG